jgi:uncharacterized protein YbjT (DUF2867 family)
MAAMSEHTDITLVLGGTGKTGRRVAERLEARGVAVRIGSRSATPAFDWEDPDTWGPALEGVGAAYISFYPDVAVPGTAHTIRAFAEQAVAAGVRRLVLLSGRGEAEAELCEQAVEDSGAETTILRCSWFAQNFSEGYFVDPVQAGVVALPVGDVGEPFVDADDIADVAVAALTEDGHAGELYELTGPRLLTFGEAVAEIAAAAGRPIDFVPIALEEYEAMLVEHEVPAEIAGLIRYLFTEVLDGRNASVADGVRRALGREPRDFREYARAVAASGMWAEQAAV